MTCLVQARFLLAAAELIYTAPVEIARIDKFEARNTDTSPRTITIHLVENGGAASAVNIRCVQVIQPEESIDILECIGHDLDPGDSIWAFASTASVVSIRVSGRLV